MIETITDKTGWAFAVTKGDTHQAVFCKEHQSLLTDQTVPVHICPRIKLGDVVVDAGANIGSHTVAYAHAVGPEGLVHAFEPYLESFCCLSFNCRDLPQVKLHHCALGLEKGRVKLVPNDNAGATHIVPKHSRDIFFNDLPSADIIALDSLTLTRLDFIKIDVEGFEPFVIRGALETIKRCRPIMFIELNREALALQGFSKAAVLNPLYDLGYTVEFTEPHHKLEMEQIDVFLLP